MSLGAESYSTTSAQDSIGASKYLLTALSNEEGRRRDPTAALVAGTSSGLSLDPGVFLQRG
jgi:hypothetical protein